MPPHGLGGIDPREQRRLAGDLEDGATRAVEFVPDDGEHAPANGLVLDQREAGLGCERAGAVELFAGTQPAHLYRSRDYGATWEEITSLLAVPGQDRWMFPPPPHQPHVKTIAFDPTDPRVLYVGIEQGALLRSADDGATWHERDAYYQPTDLFYKDIHRMVVSPRDPRRLYLATGDGLYVSADAGATWEHLCPPHGSLIGYPDGLVVLPDDEVTALLQRRGRLAGDPRGGLAAGGPGAEAGQ